MFRLLDVCDVYKPRARHRLTLQAGFTNTKATLVLKSDTADKYWMPTADTGFLFLSQINVNGAGLVTIDVPSASILNDPEFVLSTLSRAYSATTLTVAATGLTVLPMQMSYQLNAIASLVLTFDPGLIMAVDYTMLAPTASNVTLTLVTCANWRKGEGAGLLKLTAASLHGMGTMTRFGTESSGLSIATIMPQTQLCQRTHLYSSVSFWRHALAKQPKIQIAVLATLPSHVQVCPILQLKTLTQLRAAFTFIRSLARSFLHAESDIAR